MKKKLLSIDWDHTLRQLSGLDTQILTLIIYCQGMGIPVGLTTHRDRENFVLYSLYYWQYEQPQHKADALAAAIDYWQQTWFEPMGIKFDFINARYQPLYEEQNYYFAELQPFERELAAKIHQKGFFTDTATVKQCIAEYTQKKEPSMLNNEYKQAQIAWLAKQYGSVAKDTLEIWHIDDCEKVIANLPSAFQEHREYSQNVIVKPVRYKSFPLFSNPDSESLVMALGLYEAARVLLKNSKMPAMATKAEGLCVIASILFIIHGMPSKELPETKLRKFLECLESDCPALTGLVDYARSQLENKSSGQRNSCLLPNFK